METLINLIGPVVGIAVMFGYLRILAGYAKSLIARGTAEQIEAREAFFGGALLAAAFITATIDYFCGREPIVLMLWRVFAVVPFIEVLRVFAMLLFVGGACLGLAHVFHSGYFLSTSCGDTEQIKEAKFIIMFSVAGMAATAAMWLIFFR